MKKETHKLKCEKQYIILYIVLTFFIYFHTAYCSKTIHLSNNNQIVDVLSEIYLFEDKTGHLTVDDIRQNSPFILNTKPSLNFGFCKSSIWLRFDVINDDFAPVEYILTISNPDLDIIEYYEYDKDSLIRSVSTGELYPSASRDVKHKKFIFKINLNNNQGKTCYIKINNSGESTYIPIILQEEDEFIVSDNQETRLLWLIYGILMFIFLFNLYLFKSLREKINLVYSFYLLFGILFLVAFDGSLYILNIPLVTSRIKLMIPALWLIFLINFTQLFIDSKNKLKKFNIFLIVLKFILISAVPVSLFGYPFSLISIVIVEIAAVLIYLSVIYGAIHAFDKTYLPSKYFLWAFVSVLISVIIFLLKEAGILPSFLIIENSARIGITVEASLLSFAVLERFRISQEKDKRIIEQRSALISLQKEELAVINAELEKLSIVASETDSSVAIYNKELSLEWCNLGFEKLYETTLKEITESNRHHINDIIIYQGKYNLINECIANKKPLVFENRTITKSGKEIWVHSTLSPYINGDEDIEKIIAIDSNITMLKQYEQELTIAKEKAEDSDKLKSAFLSNMSHEIRTPLNAILGFSELLQNDHSSEKMGKYLKLIRNNGQHLLKIISDILDISKIESGEIRVHKTKQSIERIMSDLHEYYKLDLNSKNKNIELKLKIELKKEDIIVFTDHSKVRQILDNLLNNAIKFTQEGIIEFGVTNKGQLLEFYVKDTGIGIPVEMKDRIFERFRQIETGLSRKYEGSGIGLAISKGFTDVLGGKIWLETKPGFGSSFFFTVPYHSNSHIENSVRIDEIAAILNNKTILIADDNNDVFFSIKELFSGINLNYLYAYSGKGASDMVVNNNPDLVVLKLKLPDINGARGIKLIKEYSPDVPVIALSNIENNLEIIEAERNGFSGILFKPFTRKQLFEILDRIYLTNTTQNIISSNVVN